MDHAYVKMTKHDQEGHAEKGIEYLEVGVLHIADNHKKTHPKMGFLIACGLLHQRRRRAFSHTQIVLRPGFL